ncbi:hypothetical protein LCGC14_0441530 [marine sediment metagenome]|uniref:Uncharacterized protein n=1 Tax=marine sediment metagenome TaxID=412755 RepID=A0A0F9V7D3_9ZZZZ
MKVDASTIHERMKSVGPQGVTVAEMTTILEQQFKAWIASEFESMLGMHQCELVLSRRESGYFEEPRFVYLATGETK